MTYKGILIKLPDKKEYRFSFNTIYNIKTNMYKTLGDKDFKQLNRLISNKVTGASVKRTSFGECYITIYGEKALSYFYLETRNNELVSFNNYINLNHMLGNYYNHSIGTVIDSYDFINNTEISFVEYDKDKVMFKVSPD